MEIINLEIYGDELECSFNIHGDEYTVECLVDVETHQEDDSGSLEEIEVQGVLEKTVFDRANLFKFFVKDEAGKNINLSKGLETELKNEIENEIEKQLN